MLSRQALSLTLAAAALLAAGTLPAAEEDPLLDPAALTETAPDVYKVKFETSRGDFVVEVHREWAPLGADRFYNLVKHGFFDEGRFFRVVPGFVVQFGLSGRPEVSAVWREARIKDDPVKQSNQPGYITFATAGPDTRTTQVFINLRDNSRLDSMGFAPFGKVVEGMKVVEKLYGGYGDGAPRGRGPDQSEIGRTGNAYLIEKFPKLDHVEKASIQG